MQSPELIRKIAKQNKKAKDMKTVFLHNKAKLFESGKMLKTKE